jgi:hypothetical protein
MLSIPSGLLLGKLKLLKAIILEEYFNYHLSWPFFVENIVTWSLKVRIAELEEMYITRQRLDKHVPVAMATHATMEELLETMFSMGSILKLYKLS